MRPTHRSRSRSVRLCVFLLAFFGAAATLGAQAAAAQAGCTGTLTVSLTEGPYYKAGSPERTTLVEQGMRGIRIAISGTVYDAQCKPIAGAWLDFWQADADGVYDNQGYRLRGHLTTDAEGKFMLITIMPGEYPGRTEHIHVKLRAPNGPVVTTQIFFPGVADNDSDGIFDPSLVVKMGPAGMVQTATIDFVIPRSGA
jgi:protocatechuate 3,4-dioxygenase beta subunit